MTPPKSKTTSNTPFYSPPVEAQRQLMAKAHPVKNPGDLCLGVVKQNGGEYLAYSSDDRGGLCHVGGLTAERVGYVSAGEVQNFIAKYSSSKAAPSANSVVNLVASDKTPKMNFNRIIGESLEKAHLNFEKQIAYYQVKSAYLLVREEHLETFTDFSPSHAGLCEFFKAAKGLSKAEKKEIDWLCSQKKPTNLPPLSEFSELVFQLNGKGKR